MSRYFKCVNCGHCNIPLGNNLAVPQGKCQICTKLGKKQCDFAINSNKHSRKFPTGNLPNQRNSSHPHLTYDRASLTQRPDTSINILRYTPRIGRRSEVILVPVKQRIIYYTPYLCDNGKQSSRERDTADTYSSVKQRPYVRSSQLARKLDFGESSAKPTLINKPDRLLHPDELRWKLSQFLKARDL